MAISLGRRGAWMRAGTSIAALYFAGVPLAAAAQDNVAAEPASVEQSQPEGAAIVVTGTRVGRDGYDAPTPTTVVGRELLDAKAPATIVDALVTLPAFKNSSTASTAGVGNSGTAGQSFVNLRGIGANRTLVLLDGQRVVPSTAVGTVDVSILPSLLIERVDVVTGGASAAWGSDAVSGVVNFVLDTRFEGLRGTLEAGITDEGDNATYKGGVAFGTPLGDRGHFVISGEFLKAEGVAPFSRQNNRYPLATVVTNPGYAPTNGQFQRLILPYAYFSGVSWGGVITSGPLQGTRFGPGGAIGQFPYGHYIGRVYQALDGPADEPWLNELAYLALPQERASGFAKLSWDVGDDLSLYATALAATTRPGPYFTTPANTAVTGAFTIRRENPFIPAPIAAQMDSLSLTSISLGRYSADWGRGEVRRTNETWRGVVGLQGGIGGGWTLDAYAQYGRNTNVFIIGNNALVANLRNAIDVVQGPNGPVCRSTLTSPGNGCQPLNPFGVGVASAAAIDYVLGTSRAELELTQKVVAASVSGEPFATWAGPVSFAVGAEYREEQAVQTADALSQAGAFAIGNPQALEGGFDVREGFAELVVPLARDGGVPLHALDLNGAVRYTDYSTSGGVTTWKLGVNYAPVEGLRFRATRSRDIRAPNILELYSAPIQQSAGIIDPLSNTQYLTQTFSVGNPALEPETADTTAAGVVFQPRFLPGLQASVDYYNIEIDGAIATLSLQEIVNRCFAGSAALCDLITRSAATGAITRIDNPFLNLQSVKTDGLDIELGYSAPLGGGRFGIRLLANRVFSLETSDGVTSIDRAGDLLNGQPEWAGNLTLSYANAGFRAVADASYIGSGKYDVTFDTPTAISDNSVPARTVVNLQLSQDVGGGDGRRELFFHVANLFDTAPPPIFTISGGANYDRVGRAFRVGFRFEM
ncbi:TonB-dependent receptor domain-containing protein [Sphingosinithalassobacter sp. CS137]|uniref:TonB-dependent receptor domain-containing protein n=1 Tax=Sphingosinithalassobacter sp. CS137 TaxID=2762748 RepID=UPI00165DE40A|nr:TonB-dependent receptor [Sphingosinithalassobacter sp. CS137]